MHSSPSRTSGSALVEWAERPGVNETFARDVAVRSFYWLCTRAARQFANAGHDRRDLEQIAVVGLLKAYDRFDAGRDRSFAAYAWPTIVGELMHYVRDHGAAMRVPRRLRSARKSYNDATSALAVRLGREPNQPEILRETGVSPRDLREIELLSNFTQPMRLDDPAARTASLPTPTCPAADDNLCLRLALAELTALQRQVIVGLYMVGFTRVELGLRLGLSARHISRVHRSALAALQRNVGSAA